MAGPYRRSREAAFLSVVHDFEPGFDTYTEKPGYLVHADLGLDDVDPSSYDALVLPGGRAPEYLRNRPMAISIVRHFVENGKPIAANCHGPLLVMAAGGARGKTMTGFPDLELDFRAAAGISSSTVKLWSMGHSSRSGVGRIIAPGCASSSACSTTPTRVERPIATRRQANLGRLRALSSQAFEKSDRVCAYNDRGTQTPVVRLGCRDRKAAQPESGESAVEP